MEIAKLIRQDIKTAVREGLLPADWRYSVQSRYFAGGSSIDVRVKDCADAWVRCDGLRPGNHICQNYWCKGAAERFFPERLSAATDHSVLSETGEAAKMTLERIHGAYNHDGSDSMVDYFDVNYYGSVSFQGGW